jgi:putative membrane protein
MPDYATTDLTLAIAHHLLIFSLAGILAFEIGVIRLDMKREDLVRVARVDLWYGILAGWSSRSGFRARCSPEGLGLLLRQHVLLSKDGRLCRRRSAADRADDTDHSLAAGARRRCRIRAGGSRHCQRQTFPVAEAAVFALIPAFAGAMARGYGAMAQ